MYSDRYVAFVDILGFSAIVRKIEHDATSHRINALADALRAIGSHHPSLNGGDDFQFQTFSDSIVISSATTPTGLLHIFHSISELFIDLLKPGLLIRGAVAKGKLYHDQFVMFGPALLDAYSIETNIAKYPRVVLKSRCLSGLSKGGGGPHCSASSTCRRWAPLSGRFFALQHFERSDADC